MPPWLTMTLAMGTGCCIAMQASANSKLRQNLATPDASFVATLYSIFGTVVTVAVAMAILRPQFPSWESMRNTEWWNWIGGPLGALIVLAGATLVKDLGAATFISLVVGGQLLSSLVLDHWGLFGLEIQEISLPRIIGAVLVVAGVICIKYL